MVSWKALIISSIIHLIAGAVLYHFLLVNDPNPLLEQHIKVLEQGKEILEAEKTFSLERISLFKNIIADQREENDSLIQKIREIEKTITVKQNEIDSLIFADSTRVIELYRLALQNLGVIPDMSERLTLREIGHGAKFMTKVPQLELKINLQNKAYDISESTILEMDDLILELEHLNETEKRSTKQSELQGDLYKSAYKDATRFWANRIVVSAGVGVSYLTNKAFEPSLFVGIGIKLWGNK